MSEDEGFASTSGSEDEDRELQLAFEKGLLKPGLNVIEERVKRQPINNTAGLNAKLMEISKKQLDWVQRLDVVSRRDTVESEGTEVDREDDFAREMSFYKQAQSAVLEAIPKLHQLCVPTKRPDDYFAEMAKPDGHMRKVREKLLNIKTGKEKSEAAKKLRDQKKFAVKVQKEVLQQRQKEKRKLQEAVKQHKKGVKDQLEDALSNKKAMQSGPGGQRKLTKKAAYKEEKFGFGGKKKGLKRNTAESSADFSQFSARKHSKMKPGQKTSKVHRPGKSKRKKMRSKK